MVDDAQEFRDRIQRDRTSFHVIVCTMIAWLIALVLLLMAILPDHPGTQRTNPLYWAIMLPAAAWGVMLITLQSFAVRTLLPAIVLLPLMAVVVTLMSSSTGGWITVAVCIVFSIAAGLLWRRSALRTVTRE